MRKFKIRKKEFIVMGKDELDTLLWNIGWRIEGAITASGIAKTLIDKDVARIEREYIHDKLTECRDILDKFEESL